MKILITSKGMTKESMVDNRFGRAEYFVIFNDETNEYDGIENSAKIENSGAGVKASQLTIEMKIDCVITGSLGPKAYSIISETGIKAYKNIEGTLEENIEAYKNGELSSLTEAGKEQKKRGRV